MLGTDVFVFCFHSYGPLILVLLILSNIYTCTPHNSVTVLDIFMKCYKVKMMRRAQE